jgi:hypothetical protein
MNAVNQKNKLVICLIRQRTDDCKQVPIHGGSFSQVQESGKKTNAKIL